MAALTPIPDLVIVDNTDREIMRTDCKHENLPECKSRSLLNPGAWPELTHENGFQEGTQVFMVTLVLPTRLIFQLLSSSYSYMKLL
jgi:hypothetical protein